MAAIAAPLPIFRTAAQAKLLAHLYLFEPDRPQSLSALSKKLRIPVSTVQREVEQLERAGLVASERVGNTRLIYADHTSPYFADLQSLLLKAFGPTTLLASLLRRVRRIQHAYVYGSWARRYLEDADVVPRDLDVLIVGSPVPSQVYAAARRAEGELGLEVNPLIVSQEEWESPRGLMKRIRTGPLVEIPFHDAAETDNR